MWANRTLNILLLLVSWLVIPLQFVTTFVLGILVTITFGLLLFPLSLIWVVFFLGPLLALSWVWEKVPFLQIPIALIGIPIAFVGNIFASLMPSMGEVESRVSKLMLSDSWPYSLDCWRMINSKTISKSPGSDNFIKLLLKSCEKNPPYTQYLASLGVFEK